MSGTIRPTLTRDVRIIDTTLRDGSHAMAHRFTESQVRDTVRALDRAGVEVIEVSHGDGIGGSSFNYGFSRTDETTLIAAAREEATSAKIAVLLVPGIGTAEDLRRAHALGAGAGNSPTEVLAAVFDRLGVDTGLDVLGLIDAAEDVVRPYLPRWPKMDRNAIVQGWAGVYSSSSCTRNGRPTATRSRLTRSCAGAASSATWAARRT
ncbi:HMGL-like [Pseudonocardia oroxyli]|uniref:HMGL-like n=1 Tax=Pseudonocardia oroxyli TaxID=366584 RepID=A0A1G8E223_PSEOR|nr:HMGL-like [Pseudonocardia oroxyli]